MRNKLQCFELILLSKPRLFLLTAVLNHHAAQFCVYSDPTHDTPQYLHITQLKRRVKKKLLEHLIIGFDVSQTDGILPLSFLAICQALHSESGARVTVAVA